MCLCVRESGVRGGGREMKLLVLWFKLILTCVLISVFAFRTLWFLPFNVCRIIGFSFYQCSVCADKFFFGNPKLHLILGLLCWPIRKKVPSMQSFISSTTSSISSLE